MLGPQEQLDQGQESLRNILRRMTEAALRFDDERLPHLLRAIGNIASSSIDIDQISATVSAREQEVVTDTAEISKAISDDHIAAEPVTAELDKVDEIAADVPVAVVAEQTTQTATALASIAVRSEVKKVSKIPEIYQSAISFMISKAGEELQASDVRPYLPEMSVNQQRKVMSILYGVVNAYVPGVKITKQGETRGRRYVVHVDELQQTLTPDVDPVVELLDPTDHEPSAEELDMLEDGQVADSTDTEHPNEGEFEPVILVPVPRKASPLNIVARKTDASVTKASEVQPTEQTVTLTNWGLYYTVNGHKEVWLSGQKLKLREAAADTLLILAQFPEGIPFHTLRGSLSAKGPEYNPSFLNGILQELKFVLSAKAQNKWLDEIRQDDDGGSRHIRLEGAQPLEEYPDFLVPMRP